jgi:hypothetical protein
VSKKVAVVFTGHRLLLLTSPRAQEWLNHQFDLMFEKMEAAGCEIISIKHGGAIGADTAFDRWALQSRYKHLVQRHLPDYSGSVKPWAAPLIRNKLMVDLAYGPELGADRVVLISIFDGKEKGGTYQTREHYKKKTIEAGQEPKILNLTTMALAVCLLEQMIEEGHEIPEHLLRI